MINEIAHTDYHKVIASELRVAIRRYYDMWEDILHKDESEREGWISMIEQPRVSIVVLSCALVDDRATTRLNRGP
jgi:hypothetical protein